MTTDAGTVVFDVSAKLAAAGAFVWLATRRVRPDQADRAHLAWALLSAAFVVVSILEMFVSPRWLMTPAGEWGRSLVAVSAREASGRPVIIWYLGVVAWLLGSTAVDLWRVGRFARRSVEIDFVSNLRPACLSTVASDIRICESASLAAPATVGWWRPIVFLPAGWSEMDAGVLDAAVRHEVAHVARRDYAVGVGARVIRAVFWFHPIAWVAVGRMRWFAEVACDDAAARAVGADRYSRALLVFAREAARSQPSLVLGASSQLPRRLDLLNASAGASRRRWALRCAFAVLLALPPAAVVRAVAVMPVPAVVDHQTLHQQRHAALHHH